MTGKSRLDKVRGATTALFLCRTHSQPFIRNHSPFLSLRLRCKITCILYFLSLYLLLAHYPLKESSSALVSRSNHFQAQESSLFYVSFHVSHQLLEILMLHRSSDCTLRSLDPCLFSRPRHAHLTHRDSFTTRLKPLRTQGTAAVYTNNLNRKPTKRPCYQAKSRCCMNS